MIFINIYVDGERSSPVAGYFSGNHYRAEMRKMQAFKASFFWRESKASLGPNSFVAPSPSPTLAPSPSVTSKPRVYRLTSYGADPSGKIDSIDAIINAISEAFDATNPSNSHLMDGIKNLGGAEINLEGGTYAISRPIQLPTSGQGNFKIYGGTLKALDEFSTDGYLIDISAPSSSPSNEYDYEYITLRDLMLDSNFRGGGIQVINSLRTSIDNCYIAHFTTNGILVKGGHETYIRNSFLGQHITAGGDPRERNFSGTAINLMGNDNSVTDTVIFSASIGLMVSGQANLISGVHCYNKAAGFGGTGIYLKLPGLTQTRIVNSYMDFTGIVAEDPTQLQISGTFFLGDGYITLKSVNGIINGVNIVDNMFSGSDKGIDIVHLDQSNGNFKNIDQVVIDRNNVKGMNLKATVARGSIQGNGSSFSLDFNPILLFPNRIKNVQYTLSADGNLFPRHVLRNVSNNRVVVEADTEVRASVFVTVDQGGN